MTASYTFDGEQGVYIVRHQGMFVGEAETLADAQALVDQCEEYDAEMAYWKRSSVIFSQFED